jgi:hypothetical protein
VHFFPGSDAVPIGPLHLVPALIEVLLVGSVFFFAGQWPERRLGGHIHAGKQEGGIVEGRPVLKGAVMVSIVAYRVSGDE